MYDIQLECFLSLAETLNFSETARKLYISQQAVSKNIAKLESTVGFPLFFRNSHRVSLTPWGENYYKIYRDFCSKEAEILANYQESNNIFRILTLNQPEFAPVIHMPPFKIPNTSYYANIQLEFITPAIDIHSTLTSEADMIVINERFISDRAGLEVYPVYETQVSFLVSRNHPLYKNGALFEDFRKEPLLAGVPSSDFFETRDSLKRDIKEFGLEPASIIIMNCCEDALAAAARGDGVILGNVLVDSPYLDKIAIVPSRHLNRFVCVWNSENGKSYSRSIAEHIKNGYKNLSR